MCASCSQVMNPNARTARTGITTVGLLAEELPEKLLADKLAATAANAIPDLAQGERAA